MRIFLSSTFEDLIEYRAKAASALARLGQQGILMEVFGARPEQAAVACLDEIDQCQAMVGIYAHRYGFIPRGSRKSITEQEFDHAIKQNKQIFCFIVDDNYPWLPHHIEFDVGRSKLRAFKDSMKENMIIEKFTTPEDLAFKISSSLGRFLIAARVTEVLENTPRRDVVTTEEGRTQVARRASRLSRLVRGSHLLLINDIPTEMATPIRLFRELGITVSIALTSEEALKLLESEQFDVIVSDMARGTVADEGLRFLQTTCARGLQRPTIFTVGRYEPERGTPPYAFGITNRVDELMNFVFDALERVRG